MDSFVIDTLKATWYPSYKDPRYFIQALNHLIVEKDKRKSLLNQCEKLDVILNRLATVYALP